MKKLLIAMAATGLLSACGGEDASNYVQQKISATEPDNHTAETANEIPPGSGVGVYGDLVAGEEDYYYIEIDFFDSGIHTVTLTDLAEDLDLEVIDHNGLVHTSEASGTTDETVIINTNDVSFFGDDIDFVTVQMKVYGATETSASRFTLKMITTD